MKLNNYYTLSSIYIIISFILDGINEGNSETLPYFMLSTISSLVSIFDDWNGFLFIRHSQIEIPNAKISDL